MRLKRKLFFKIIAPLIFIGLILYFIIKPETPDEVIEVLSLALIIFLVLFAIYITLAIIFKIKKIQAKKRQKRESKNKVKTAQNTGVDTHSTKNQENANTPQKIEK